MRLFLGIYPPKEYLDYLRDISRKFFIEKRNLNFVPIDQLHVTMRFIGPEVSDKSKDIIVEELLLHQGNYGKADLELNRIRFGFDYDRNPRILHADLADNESLINIGRNIHTRIKELRLRDTIRIKNKWSEDYHITIARLKANATKKQGKNVSHIVSTLHTPTLEPVTVNEMYLIESIYTKGQKPIYRKLTEIKL